MKRATVLMLAGMLATAVAFAQPAKQAGKTDRAARIAEKLGLTPEQQSAIDAIRNGERDRLEAIHDAIRTKAVRFTELRDANDPAADAVRAEIEGLREEAKLRRLAMRSKIGDVLTPEQRQTMKEMASRRGRHGQGRRGGGNRGPGR